METRFTILLIELGVAITVQIGILIAILVSVRRSTKRMESLASQVEQRAIPLLDSSREMVETSRPLVQDLLTNLSSSSAVLRKEIERLDLTLSDIMDRARLQVIRADELTSRAMDKVEEASETVSKGVSVPARQFAGLVQGLSTGIATFFGKPPRDRNMQRDEMFI
ncbi:MAG: hypothetical protein AB7O65_06200 [Candidatus Korobacteraceae bacterium]